MRALIASDDQSVATRLRNILVAEGIDCPAHWVVSTESLNDVVATETVKPHLILFVVPQDIDRSVVLLQELRRGSSAGVVAVGSVRDPRQILRLVRLGSDDYLDADGELEHELAEFLKRFCVVEDRPKEQGRLITIISASGGSGQSFLAANIATVLAKQHGRCALCDMDLRRGDLVSLLNLKPRYTINDLCRNLGRLDQGMFEQSLLQHESGVHLLAAPQEFTDVEPINSAAAEKIMRHAQTSFPYVIVDLEDFFHREQLQVLQMSDLTLLVLRLDFTSLRNARRTLEYMKMVGVDQEKVRIVVNMHGRPKELPVGEAEDALGMKFSFFVPDDPKTALVSLNRGLPAVQCAPKTKLVSSISEIAAALAKDIPLGV